MNALNRTESSSPLLRPLEPFCADPATGNLSAKADVGRSASSGSQLRSIGFWQAYAIYMSRLIKTFFIAFIFSGASMTSSATPKATATTPLISFQSPEEARAWRTVNDDVMGGRSLGKSVVEAGQLLFIGVINTDGGGFSSIRREMQPGALEEARAIILSVKPDGRPYKLIAQTNARFRGRYVSYQAPIPTSPAGEWSDVRIAFSDFVPSVFGRIVSASEFSPAKVTQLGFIIADDVDGDFALSVRSISTER